MNLSIHLLTSSQFITKNDNEFSRLMIAKFIESCSKLDPLIFEPFISDDAVFENKEKYKFLTGLKTLFQPYQSKTNVFTVRVDEKSCLGCSAGKSVMQFTVYFTDDRTEVADFGFVIDKQNGILKDIYRCWQYSSECEPTQIKPENLPSINIQ